MVPCGVWINFGRASVILLIATFARRHSLVVAFTRQGLSTYRIGPAVQYKIGNVLFGSISTEEGIIQTKANNNLTMSEDMLTHQQSPRRKTMASTSDIAKSKSKRDKSKKSTISTNNIDDDDPWHWTVPSDDFLLEYHMKDHPTETETQKRPRSIRFKVRGNPRPLRRHRSGNGHLYNPSFKFQHSFQKSVERLLSEATTECDIPVESRELQQYPPLFEAHEHLAMTIVFRMKRPKCHFINGKPGLGRLKETSPPQLSTIRTDVDNLTKFVLDSMNGILYDDDRQIVSMHVTKILDNEDLCQGSTEIHLRSIQADSLESLLTNPLFVGGKGNG